MKHSEVLSTLLEAHAKYVRDGARPVNTLTIEEYAQRQQVVDTVRVPMMSWGDGDRIQI